MTTRIKNLNKQTLFEALALINEHPEYLNEDQPFAFHRGSALHQVFQYAFNLNCKFKLPDGIPPYTPSNTQPGMQPTDLLVAIQRGQFKYLVDPYIKDMKREQIFINLLETVDSNEARVLLAIKDQQLNEMFANITPELLVRTGYIEKGTFRSNTEEKASQEQTENVDDNNQTQSTAQTKQQTKTAAKKRTTTRKRSSKITKSNDATKKVD